jgi:hypothetical protein
MVQYPMWRLRADWKIETELLTQPLCLSGAASRPCAGRRPVHRASVLVANPQPGRAPPGPPAAAERLFLPADPVYTSELAGCSVRNDGSGLLVLVSVLEGDGFRDALAITTRWTANELDLLELDPASESGWTAQRFSYCLETPIIPLNQVRGLRVPKTAPEPTSAH